MACSKDIPPYRIQVSKVRMMMYAAATWNPYQLHWDSEFSKSRGFADANVAGPMFGDYLAEMLIRWAGHPSRLKTLEYTNRNMAFPGDTLICRGEVRGSILKDGTNIIDCRVWVESQEGRILAEGSATVSQS
ncbi:MAG: dehydratase [Deltaproteobacteria bacterium]|jgi:hydroxyacyl-ACP dehydratase HTD2-like protein with hotdog domain|nr:dehydratase [Deltaproteobacteria bacterium]